jgi:hypothetical protein
MGTFQSRESNFNSEGCETIWRFALAVVSTGATTAAVSAGGGSGGRLPVCLQPNSAWPMAVQETAVIDTTDNKQINNNVFVFAMFISIIPFL